MVMGDCLPALTTTQAPSGPVIQSWQTAAKHLTLHIQITFFNDIREQPSLRGITGYRAMGM